MSPVRPAPHDVDGPQPRPWSSGSSSAAARPPVRSRTGTVARLRIMLYRHRWLRWAAAAGAALVVLATLADDPSGPASAPAATAPPGPAALLPPGTRGVPIPVDSEVFAAGDTVDVHAILDGTAVVQSALIVDVSQDEVVVAVPGDQVDAAVDALTTGGVVLVLVSDATAPVSTQEPGPESPP